LRSPSLSKRKRCQKVGRSVSCPEKKRTAVGQLLTPRHPKIANRKVKAGELHWAIGKGE
jgi:hypothetical protein